MKGIFALVAFLLLDISSAWGASGRLKFENRHKEFGKVIRGQVLEHTFKFRNSGKDPIRIMGVSTDCGCTIVRDFHQQSFAPGASSELRVQLDTTDFVGSVRREISVITNAKGQKSYNLYLKATVDTEFDVSPVLVDFGSVHVDKARKVNVFIKRARGHKASVVGLSQSSELIRAELSKVGEGWTVSVDIDSDAPPGFLKEFVVVRTNSFHLPKIKIPVRANLDGGLSHKPNYVEFGAVPKGEGAIRKVMFEGSQDDLEFEIESFLINGKEGQSDQFEIGIDGTKVTKDKKEVSIKLKNKSTTPGNVHGIMVFKSKTDKALSASIEFYGLFR